MRNTIIQVSLAALLFAAPTFAGSSPAPVAEPSIEISGGDAAGEAVPGDVPEFKTMDELLEYMDRQMARFKGVSAGRPVSTTESSTEDSLHQEAAYCLNAAILFRQFCEFWTGYDPICDLWFIAEIAVCDALAAEG